jgi:hypothetical protein
LRTHQLDHLSIAAPSKLIYKLRKTGKPTVTVELLTRDPRGALRFKRTVTFSRPLQPFPPGYEITGARRRGSATLPNP